MQTVIKVKGVIFFTSSAAVSALRNKFQEFVYFTFFIDVLDGSVAVGVGGGFFSQLFLEAKLLAKHVFAASNL